MSQFYETILGLTFLLMFVTLFLTLCKGALHAIQRQRELEDKDFERWEEMKYRDEGPGASQEEIGKQPDGQEDIPRPGP